MHPTDAVLACLLLCLQARWLPAALPTAQRLADSPGFDWPAWMSLAQREQVAPLIYATLRSQTWPPPAVLEELRKAYMRNGSRNTLILSELATVLQRLTAAGIGVIVLKGAALAEAVYGNVALRAMLDLDLLLKREDVPTAIEIVAPLGYAAVYAEPRAGASLAYESEILLGKPGPLAVALELHWGLVDSPYYQQRLHLDWFWQTAQPAQVSGVSTLILGHEAQLLHLCAHLALHHGGGEQPVLLWQHDVAELLHLYRDRLDWELLLTQAQAFDLVLPLQQVLGTVSALWQAPIPEAAVQRLHQMAPTPAEVRTFRRLTAGQRPVLQRFRDDLAAFPDWRSRVAFTLANLFPSPAYMRQRYDLPQDFPILLSYPYRWTIGLQEAIAHRRARR